MALISNSNLKWYLTGGAGNSSPAASLGGAVSSTEVGSSINNLFDDVTGDEASAGDTEYRCIAFKNTDANANGLLSAKLWIDTQTTSADTSIAIGLDLAGKTSTPDDVADESTAPDPVVTFTTPTSKATGIALPSPMAQNDYIGVWIKRIVTNGAAATASDSCSLSVEGDSIP
jgi:hypothetical protein